MSGTSVVERFRRWLDGWMDELQEKIAEIEDDEDYASPKTRPIQVQRPLEDDDIEGWFKTAYNPLAEAMERDHPWRWARMQRDIKWIKKEMRKLGLNPNDYKWWVT